MTFERGLLAALVVTSLTVFALAEFNPSVMAIIVAFLTGGLIWLALMERVPCRLVHQVYLVGWVIPITLAYIALVVVR